MRGPAAAPSLHPHELAREPVGPHRLEAAALCEAQGEASAAPGEASSRQPAGSCWGIHNRPNALTPQNSSLSLSASGALFINTNNVSLQPGFINISKALKGSDGSVFSINKNIGQ